MSNRKEEKRTTIVYRDWEQDQGLVKKEIRGEYTTRTDFFFSDKVEVTVDGKRDCEDPCVAKALDQAFGAGNYTIHNGVIRLVPSRKIVYEFEGYSNIEKIRVVRRKSWVWGNNCWKYGERIDASLDFADGTPNQVVQNIDSEYLTEGDSSTECIFDFSKVEHNCYATYSYNGSQIRVTDPEELIAVDYYTFFDEEGRQILKVYADDLERITQQMNPAE